MNLFNQISSEHQKLLLSDKKDTIINVGHLLNIKMLVSKKKKKNQVITGLCIAQKNRGLNTNFIVRNILNNEGIEYKIPLYSPMVLQINQIKQTDSNKNKRLRGSKLYYLRNKININTV